MRHVVSLFVAIACTMSHAAAFQTRSGGAASATPSACSLLTPDIVKKYVDERAIKLLKPDDSPVGTKGTSCEYGRIGLRMNPFGESTAPKSLSKDWQPVSGVGNAAFYDSSSRQYAELIVWTGRHHFGIQLGVPTGGTIESTRTEAIALANDIIKKLP
jgi:hypothetical protein